MDRTNALDVAIEEYFPALLRRAKSDPHLLATLQNAVEAIEVGSLSWARLNQILHLCSEAGMSEGFYKYYFLTEPKFHPYPVRRVFPEGDYDLPEGLSEVKSLQQFQWGVRRFMYDAMLFWGNFRQAYRELRQLSADQIEQLFTSKRVNEGRLVRRGKVVEPTPIAHDDRHLISETACKTYEAQPRFEDAPHVRFAIDAFRALKQDTAKVTSTALKQKTREYAEKAGQLGLFELLFLDSDRELSSEADVLALYSGQYSAFKRAREAALNNTRIYLSICSDLDVYVATSMRTRDEFREMARTCEQIFRDERLRNFNVRYFDPTLSAANYHEDKGIIECLMVKTAKALLYFAQNRESLGKVSEYAMALSLGKPVIILCPPDQRGSELVQFYRDRHPLLRLIEFETGIINGAMVTQNPDAVVRLLERIYSNRMEYDLARKPNTNGYFLLKERLTDSTIRVITDDRLLSETFWNNYHQIY